MTTGILSIFAAILLSIISAFFSVSGITTIFSGAAISAGIMGGVLELSKIAATLWLYAFWKKAAKLLKVYFLIAISILVSISSIGIYGFLARAYVGQSVETTQIDNQIERLQNYIDREQNQITRSQAQLDILDDAIEQYIELNAITRGLQQREAQQAERAQLLNATLEAEAAIVDLENQIAELRDRKANLEVDVGPIRYIAALVYGEENAIGKYDEAARILILLFVIVFDPFAVLLMVAGNIAIEKSQKEKKRIAKNRQRRERQRKEKEAARSPAPETQPSKPNVENVKKPNVENVKPKPEKKTPAKPREEKPAPAPDSPTLEQKQAMYHENDEDDQPIEDDLPKLTPRKVKRTKRN